MVYIFWVGGPILRWVCEEPVRPARSREVGWMCACHSGVCGILNLPSAGVSEVRQVIKTPSTHGHRPDPTQDSYPLPRAAAHTASPHGDLILTIGTDLQRHCGTHHTSAKRW